MGDNRKDKSVTLESLDLGLVEKYALEGWTPARIARLIGVDERTLLRWRQIDPKLDLLVSQWRENAVKNVEQKLFEIAEGWETEETKHFSHLGLVTDERTVLVKHKPDAQAQKFILTNLASDKWKDRRQDDVSLQGSIELTWLGTDVPTREELLE